jgi:hypothetical protein
MDVVADLDRGGVVLHDRDDLGRFAVRARTSEPGDAEGNGALGALAACLSFAQAGRVDSSGDVFVPVDALRRLAAAAAEEDGTTLGEEWEAGFAAMLERAGSTGWLAEDGAVRAHVEWERV